MYDYGECQVCSTLMVEKMIQQDFWIKGKLIVVENLPTGVCPQCGEKIVTAEVGQQVASLLKDSKRIEKAPTISVPLIKFEKAIAV